jgi:hypothetical protein
MRLRTGKVSVLATSLVWLAFVASSAASPEIPKALAPRSPSHWPDPWPGAFGSPHRTWDQPFEPASSWTESRYGHLWDQPIEPASSWPRDPTENPAGEDAVAASPAYQVRH